MGLVGESGCGKSVTSLTDHAAARHPAGGDRRRARSGSTAVTCCAFPKSEMREVRGNDITMIFQEPMTSLNPVFTIGDQIGEAVVQHRHVSKKAGLDRAIEMLAPGRHPRSRSAAPSSTRTRCRAACASA